MFSLTYFFALGLILVLTHGHYVAALVPALIAIHVAFTVMALRPNGVAAALEKKRELLCLGLLVFALLLAFSSQLIYPVNVPEKATLARLLAALPIVLAGLWASWRYRSHRVARYLFFGAAGLAVLILVVSRVLVLKVSPRPFIDVWTSSQQAVQYFVHGQNPYAQPYVDIYGGRFDYFPSFPYWPGYLYWATLWSIVLPGPPDVRASLLISELLAGVFLFLFARKLKIELPWALVLVLVWLAFPIDLFIEEQAWIDPLLLAGFAGATWMLASRRFIAAGCFLGFACGTKQYVFIGCFFLLAYVWRAYGRGAAIRLTASAAAVFAVLIVPFAVANWHQFYLYTISSWSGALPRPDSLSALALVADLGAFRTPDELRSLAFPFTVLTLLSLAGFLFWLARKKAPTLRETFAATSACYGFMLLFAKQSFCNYYYFLSFFVIVAGCAAWAESPGEAV